MYCSMAERPCPPYSFGQPMPSQPSVLRSAALAAAARAQLGAQLVGDEIGEVAAQLVAQRGLLGRKIHVHGSPSACL
jgi:hypothetical protein